MPVGQQHLPLHHDGDDDDDDDGNDGEYGDDDGDDNDDVHDLQKYIQLLFDVVIDGLSHYIILVHMYIDITIFACT